MLKCPKILLFLSPNRVIQRCWAAHRVLLPGVSCPSNGLCIQICHNDMLMISQFQILLVVTHITFLVKILMTHIGIFYKIVVISQPKLLRNAAISIWNWMSQDYKYHTASEHYALCNTIKNITFSIYLAILQSKNSCKGQFQHRILYIYQLLSLQVCLVQNDLGCMYATDWL